MFQLDLLATPGWIALGSILTAVGAWLLNLKRISAAVAVEHERVALQKADAESSERDSFRTVLLREVHELRVTARECENDKAALVTRISLAEGRIIVLEASNQIMERWIAFFKERSIVPDDFQIKTAPGD